MTDVGLDPADQADPWEPVRGAEPGVPTRRPRWHIPAAVAAVMAAALVGGVIVGSLIPARDEAALEPSPSPERTLITTSSDPSASGLAVTLAPTGSPASSMPPTDAGEPMTTNEPAPPPSESSPEPSRTPSSTARSTSGPTPQPTEQARLDWEFVTGPIEVAAAEATDMVVGPDGKVYTFFWNGEQYGNTPVPVLVYDPETHGTRIVDADGPSFPTEVISVAGPDGLIYNFGRLGSRELVVAFDPREERWISEGMPTLPGETLDAVLGSDGAIYLLVHRPDEDRQELWALDVATGATLLVGAVPWEAAALVSLADGDLLTVDEVGIGAFDLSAGEWGSFVRGRPPPDAPEWARIYHYAAVSAEGTVLVPHEGPWWLWDGGWATVNDPDVYSVPVVHADGEWIALVDVDSQPATVRIARAPGD